MPDFKQLVFTDLHRDKGAVKMRAYVPGINSGCYDKTLHFSIEIIELKKTFLGKTAQTTSGSITISTEAVEKLRDECNKILSLFPEKRNNFLERIDRQRHDYYMRTGKMPNAVVVHIDKRPLIMEAIGVFSGIERDRFGVLMVFGMKLILTSELISDEIICFYSELL